MATNKKNKKSPNVTQSKNKGQIAVIETAKQQNKMKSRVYLKLTSRGKYKRRFGKEKHIKILDRLTTLKSIHTERAPVQFDVKDRYK